MERLKDTYQKEAVPAMKQAFGYTSSMQVPRIERVAVNTGFGRLVSAKTGDDQRKAVEAIVADLEAICGQKPVLAKARKSVAGFKLREGQAVGAKVTLRGSRMERFLAKLLQVALPRSRDFRGIAASSLDEQGNLTLGIPEHVVFPEIAPEKIRIPFGLEITITTTARSREEGLELFRLLGFPMQKA